MSGSSKGPVVHGDAESCVDRVIATVGKDIRLGLPLGLGKPNSFANALYRRACQDPDISLQIFTALTLDRPAISGELERRFLEPLQERVFGNYPELQYSADLRKGALPANVKLFEFYFQPGNRLSQPQAQQNRLDSNYTHVVRDGIDRGINVIANLVATRSGGDEETYSLSCNADIFVDLLPRMEAWRKEGRQIALVAEINENLPYMLNDAEVDRDVFDHVILQDRPHFDLFGVPNRSVTLADHATGLHASRFVRDGGTLQLGIGSFSDAATHALLLRHTDTEVYRQALVALGVDDAQEYRPFESGLYGCSEMLVEGFTHLMRAGIMNRRVYSHPSLQVLANAGELSDRIEPDMLERLMRTGHLGPAIGEEDFRALQRHGVFRPDVGYEDGKLVTPSGEAVPAYLQDESSLQLIREHCLGEELRGGIAIHGGFFLGSPAFYQTLRELSEETRTAINMTGVHFINSLHGQETLKTLQRRKATFINSAMKVSLHGAVISDTLEDYKVVSGVGGQFNFVSMAHALTDARAIIVLNSTRTHKGRRTSNIVWDYPNVTVPGHLRDVVVTEYGVADIRGKSDSEIMAALINIADSAFQPKLLEKAKSAGKIERGYRIPEQYTRNTPEHLRQALEPLRAKGKLPRFPLGTVLDEDEKTLLLALRSLQQKTGRPSGWVQLAQGALLDGRAGPEHRRYLERLGLERPATLKERLLQRLIVMALNSHGA
ncbi:MAG: acetyl-CoA hydrolase/transferase C-terminal domain-containing protein [Rhodovibrionaceae bacterium]|nr:acetyl-CoA hydrolase/transferase C-terminal domain-containing protein [Rhodovibrionaceae bacterium]